MSGNTSSVRSVVVDDGINEHITTERNGESGESVVSFQLIAFTGIGVVGLLGNIGVILVFTLSKAMRKKFNNWFLINQSVLDGMASMWLIVNAWDNLTPHDHSGILGELRCRLLTNRFFVWVTYLASTYNLVMISVERYFGIVHAIYYRNHFKWWVVCIMLFIPYLLSCIENQIGLVAAKVIDGFCYEVYNLSPNTLAGLGTLNFIYQLVFPIAVMSFCYIRIGFFLKNMKKVGTSDNPAKAKKEAKTTVNIVKTLLIVCLMFFLCWVNNAVLFFLYTIGVVSIDFNGAFYHFTLTAVHMNCIVNPFIYTFKYEQFRHEARRLLFKSSGKVDSIVNTSTQGTMSTVVTVG